MKLYLKDNRLARELCLELLGQPKAIGIRFDLIEVDLVNKKWTTIFNKPDQLEIVDTKELIKNIYTYENK
jgi:hypothetical protein